MLLRTRVETLGVTAHFIKALGGDTSLVTLKRKLRAVPSESYVLRGCADRDAKSGYDELSAVSLPARRPEPSYPRKMQGESFEYPFFSWGILTRVYRAKLSLKLKIQ
jgi:hypothetical protein